MMFITYFWDGLTLAFNKQLFSELISFYIEKSLGYHKLVGQGYDGAATFSDIHNGVQKLAWTHAAHAFYIHC